MKNIFLVLSLLFFISFLSAEPLSWISGRMYAIGGPHTSDGKTFASVFYNPAFFAFSDDQVLFTDISLGISGYNHKLSDLVKHGDYIGLIPINEGTYFKADLSGPINSGFLKEGAGFRVYNELDVLTFTPNLLVSSALRVKDQLVFQGGSGGFIPLPAQWKGEASWGVLGKFFVEWYYIYNKDILEFFYSFTEPSLFAKNPMQIISGAGLDIGFLHKMSQRFSYGLTLHDAFSPLGDFTYSSVLDYENSQGYSHVEFGLKPVVLSFGLKYSPRIFNKKKWIGPWDLYLDYRDIFDFAYKGSRNPVLNLGTGSELRILQFFDLRLGLNEGLLSFGTAMNFKYWSVGISFYGNELTLEPGTFSVYSVKLNIEIHK